MDLIARDKINLDIFWLKDDALDDPDLLPPPDEIAAEIVENLEAALDRFRKVALSLQSWQPEISHDGLVNDESVTAPGIQICCSAVQLLEETSL